jgi:hypothetical protein
MPVTHNDLADVFPLGVIANQLDNFQLPTGDFDPAGDWEQTYAQITVGQVGSARVGQVRLRRRQGGTLLRVEYEKPGAAGTVHWETADVTCAPDALSTPSQWTLTCETVTVADGKLVPDTRIEKTGTVKGDILEIADSRAVRKLPKPAAFTINWLLFDVVQRLPREPFEPLRFTLLDDFDQPKPNLTLAFWQSTELMIGGKRVQQQEWEQLEKGRVRRTVWGREGDQPVRLAAYSLLGPGTVPWVYHVDDRGRLLFAIAGLEAYVLQPPATRTP